MKPFTHSPLTIDVYNQVFSYTLPCTSVVIAGSAAIHLGKAGDIDVWFLKSDLTKANKYLRALPYHASALNYQYSSTGIFVGEGYIPGCLWPIQVLGSHCKDAQELVDSFDITTHAHAIVSRKLQIVSSQFATDTTEAPRLMPKTSARSLGRYIKICARYGFAPDAAILKKLTVNPLDELNTPLTEMPGLSFWLDSKFKFDPSTTNTITYKSILQNLVYPSAAAPLSWDSETAQTKMEEDYDEPPF